MPTKLQHAAWRLVLPEIRKMVKEEIQAEATGLRAEMGGEFKAIHSEINRLDEKISGADIRLGEKIDGLDKRLDVVQRLAVVEAKLRGYEQKEKRS